MNITIHHSIVSFLALALALTLSLVSRTLEVGTGKQFSRFQMAASQAQAGDTILFSPGIFSGGDAISNLQGTMNSWIVVRAEIKGSTIFRGGSQAFQLSDGAYIRFENLVFEAQTANGVNIDDAGTFETPTHHITFENCEWRSMAATGNNDELKLSGLDDFEIRNCRFANGSVGGSLIDMVGCHRGLFTQNVFENGGSNCIQAKGGTSEILIERNKFLNGGERAINIGGSTGLAFFRPQDANYEAKNIEVYSNIFTGGTTPIAFVGAVNSKVCNNTIIRPTRWALRILQETVDARFLPCGSNEFRNNIIVYGNTGTVAVNVGGNTAPETFQFSNNLWFNPDNASWSGPNTPTVDPNRILNRDPLFSDTVSFLLRQTSPAIGSGITLSTPTRDFLGNPFANPPSIGAVEGKPIVGNMEIENGHQISSRISDGELVIATDLLEGHTASVCIVEIETGKEILWVNLQVEGRELRIPIGAISIGFYLVRIAFDDNRFSYSLFAID